MKFQENLLENCLEYCGKNKLCNSCLRRGHIPKYCRWHAICKKCGENIILCFILIMKNKTVVKIRA